MFSHNRVYVFEKKFQPIILSVFFKRKSIYTQPNWFERFRYDYNRSKHSRLLSEPSSTCITFFHFTESCLFYIQTHILVMDLGFPHLFNLIQGMRKNYPHYVFHFSYILPLWMQLIKISWFTSNFGNSIFSWASWLVSPKISYVILDTSFFSISICFIGFLYLETIGL